MLLNWNIKIYYIKYIGSSDDLSYSQLLPLFREPCDRIGASIAMNQLDAAERWSRQLTRTAVRKFASRVVGLVALLTTLRWPMDSSHATPPAAAK